MVGSINERVWHASTGVSERLAFIRAGIDTLLSSGDVSDDNDDGERVKALIRSMEEEDSLDDENRSGMMRGVLIVEGCKENKSGIVICVVLLPLACCK